MKVLVLLCLTGFLFAGAVPAQKERFVRPVDEAAKDASFLAFRTKLIAAVQRRDAKYVLSVVDRNIKNSFGGNDGVAEFKKWWKIESPQSKFWDEFLPVITNGGTFFAEGGGRMFTAPYTFSGLPRDLDDYEYSAIFGNNVNLRERPDMKAPVVARLSYNIVKVDYPSSVKKSGQEYEYSWLKIETLGGKKGFVDARFVRSPLDYRAGFERKNGQWKMTYFLSGD